MGMEVGIDCRFWAVWEVGCCLVACFYRAWVYCTSSRGVRCIDDVETLDLNSRETVEVYNPLANVQYSALIPCLIYLI
jgi:hypothetical protein